MFSNTSKVAATVYPDSDKIAIWTGNDEDDLVVRRTSGVSYWDVEAGLDGSRYNSWFGVSRRFG